jgi:hypothetical protein
MKEASMKPNNYSFVKQVIQPFAGLLNDNKIGVFPKRLNINTEPPTIIFGQDSFVKLCCPRRTITPPLIRVSHLPGSGVPYTNVLSHMDYSKTKLSQEHQRLGRIVDRAEEQLARMDDPESQLEEWAFQRPQLESSPSGLSKDEVIKDKQAQDLFYKGVYFAKYVDPQKLLLHSARNFAGAGNRFAEIGNHTAAAMALELGAYVRDLVRLADPPTDEGNAKSTSFHVKAHQEWLASIATDPSSYTNIIRMFQGLSLATGVQDWEHASNYLKAIGQLSVSAKHIEPSWHFTLRQAWILLHDGSKDDISKASDLMNEVSGQCKNSMTALGEEAAELKRIASVAIELNSKG